MLRILKEVNLQELQDIKKSISKISKTLKILTNKKIKKRHLNNLMLNNLKPNKIMNKTMKPAFNNKIKNNRNNKFQSRLNKNKKRKNKKINKSNK